ncbi:DUF58 domain-containing protein [Natronomonas amylolytica]|uniref:DUF58 domain-containing protein n=1 Tax=Natronomonas amylolytica TaxID=3108498 RepID=UPI00300937A7
MAPSVPAVRPTRRGLAVFAVAVGAFLLGATGGARSLNAVVVPALVALAASAVQLYRADPPTVERSVPEPGFAGERRRVTATVDSGVPCTVHENADPGLHAESLTATVGHGGRFTYDIGYRRRGEYTLGPADCVQTDSLGLFRRTVASAERDPATPLVYPDIYDLDTDLARLVGTFVDDDRSSFDRLREYVPDDSMRDIHWRASAKRPDDDFLVAEYGSRGATDEVTVVGEAATDRDSADAMAATVASVAAHFHDFGVTVAVRVPGGDRIAPPGSVEGLLELLATTGGGRVETDGQPEVHVVAENGTARVTLDDRDVAFEAGGETRGREVVA